MTDLLQKDEESFKEQRLKSVQRLKEKEESVIQALKMTLSTFLGSKVVFLKKKK
jgi:hypothetical protein